MPVVHRAKGTFDCEGKGIPSIVRFAGEIGQLRYTRSARCSAHCCHLMEMQAREHVKFMYHHPHHDVTIIHSPWRCCRLLTEAPRARARRRQRRGRRGRKAQQDAHRDAYHQVREQLVQPTSDEHICSAHERKERVAESKACLTDCASG